MKFLEWRKLVHLAYIDDSGSKSPEDRKSPFQIVGSVIVSDKDFLNVEFAANLGFAEDVPDDKYAEFVENFTEFHAAELFWGHGIWEGIPQEHRFNKISHLLSVISSFKLPIIYGAIDKVKLENALYASANPMDMAFKVCAEGIVKWMSENAPRELCLFIADDSEDKRVRADLRRAFRQLRPALRPPYLKDPQGHIHDDMYFGDSRDSIGIQLADLCSFFIFKHQVSDNNADSEGFYKLLEPHIFYGEIQPK